MEMKFEEIAKFIFDDIVPKLECNKGVAICVEERAKFEGWLKIELCESLAKYKHFDNIIPENNRIDVTFDNWAVELKTLNTNYRYNNVKNKNRPITKNVQGVISDIKKLKNTTFANKAVLFIVFPATHNNKNWKKHLQKISMQLRDLKYREFSFREGIPGVIYFGLI